MNTRTLGRTGIEVTELALGGLFVSKYGAEFADGRAAIHRAVELGINYIDTAPGYGNSEEVIGKSLVDIDAPLVISTKLGGRPNPFEPKNKYALLESLQTSLKLLGREQVEILMIHEPDRTGQYDWWDDFAAAEGPVMEVLDAVRAEGLVKYIGLGGTTVHEMARLCNTGKFDVVLTAFNFSLLWREAEEAIFPAARAHNMGVVIGSPLQQGALAVRYDEAIASGAQWMAPKRREQFRALYALVDELGMPIADLANRFVISHPTVSTVLTGARSVQEVELNYAAIEQGPLPADVLARLDEIAAIQPCRPYLEPFSLPMRGSDRPPIGRAC